MLDRLRPVLSAVRRELPSTTSFCGLRKTWEVQPSLEEKRFSGHSVLRSDWKKLIFVLFLALFLFGLALRTVDKIVLYFRLEQELRELTAQEEALRQEVGALKKERQFLEEDWYIEKLAREKLRLVKPGEILVRVLEE
jgi:cell division protein FtsB